MSYQHVDMMHEVQKEHSQLHDEVCVVDVCSLTLPGSWMVQIPQMNGVSEGTCTALSGHETKVIFRQYGG